MLVPCVAETTGENLGERKLAVHALLLLAFLFLSTAVQVLIVSVQSCCLHRDLSHAGVSWLAYDCGELLQRHL